MRIIRLLFPVLIALFLIVSDHTFSYLERIRSTINYALSPIQVLTNLPFQFYTWVNEQGTSRDLLMKNNQYLTDENAKLKVRLQQLEALKLENKKLKKLLESKYTTQENRFVLASVNAVNKSRLKKQISVNRGSDDGVKVGQAVLGAQGVIGQVVLTTPGSANVSLVSDPTQHVPVKSARSAIRGMAKGMALNQELLTILFVERDADVKAGDLFLTSGVGGKFPNGYPLGSVVEVGQQDYEPFLQIQVRPLQSTQDLEFVIIATDGSWANQEVLVFY